MCAEVIQAPVALILRVFVSSINSAPDTSVPLKKTGTCKRMRGERRVDEVSKSCLFLSVSVFIGCLWLGTEELVRVPASWMPQDQTGSSYNLFILRCVQAYVDTKNSSGLAHWSGNPLPFLNCANGTLLPLTLRSPSVTMPTRENFYHFTRGGIA